MALIIDKRFKIIEHIGEGGMGIVYRGVDIKTDKPVAIKQLKREALKAEPSLIKRFEREGYILRQLNHPNVVRRYAGPVRHRGEYYIVMEFVPGGTLEDLIKKYRRLSVQKALSIALELSDALTRAHHLNIIHRDLKPANILLTQNEKPRLTDFGIAHIDDRTRLTNTNDMLGTWAYLSPEVVSGKKVNGTTDIWSFGILLFEMLEGTIPFSDTSPVSIVNTILHDELKQGEYIPARIQSLISRMLEKDPAKRLPSMRAVGAEIQAILHGSNPIDLRPQIDLMSELSQLMISWEGQLECDEKHLSRPLDQQAFYYHSGMRDTLRVIVAEVKETLTKHKIILPPFSGETDFLPMSLTSVQDLFHRSRLEVKNVTSYDDYTFTASFPVNLRVTNAHRLMLLEQYMPNIIIINEGYAEGNLPFIHFAFRQADSF